MNHNENTTGPQASDIPAHAYAAPEPKLIMVSTDDLADYPVGTTVIVDEERWELYKRVQIADGTRVVLATPTGTEYREWAVEVATSDRAEPLWQVEVYPAVEQAIERRKGPWYLNH